MTLWNPKHHPIAAPLQVAALYPYGMNPSLCLFHLKLSSQALQPSLTQST